MSKAAGFLTAAVLLMFVDHSPASAAMSLAQCAGLTHEWAERAKHFGLMLVPFKNDLLSAMNPGGNPAAVKCAYLRRIEIDQAAIYRLAVVQVRNCPSGRFIDPQRSAQMLQETREREAEACGRR